MKQIVAKLYSGFRHQIYNSKNKKNHLINSKFFTNSKNILFIFPLNQEEVTTCAEVLTSFEKIFVEKELFVIIKEEFAESTLLPVRFNEILLPKNDLLLGTLPGKETQKILKNLRFEIMLNLSLEDTEYLRMLRTMIHHEVSAGISVSEEKSHFNFSYISEKNNFNETLKDFFDYLKKF